MAEDPPVSAMCATPRSARAWPSAATVRRADSRATACASSTTTTCAPRLLSSATDEPYGAGEGVLEDAVEAGRVERLGDERCLIERLELARPARNLRAVPIGGGKQVVLLSSDPGADRGAGSSRLDVYAHERARGALRAIERRTHGAQLDVDLAPAATKR